MATTSDQKILLHTSKSNVSSSTLSTPNLRICVTAFYLPTLLLCAVLFFNYLFSIATKNPASQPRSTTHQMFCLIQHTHLPNRIPKKYCLRRMCQLKHHCKQKSSSQMQTSSTVTSPQEQKRTNDANSRDDSVTHPSSLCSTPTKKNHIPYLSE